MFMKVIQRDARLIYSISAIVFNLCSKSKNDINDFKSHYKRYGHIGEQCALPFHIQHVNVHATAMDKRVRYIP